MRNFAGVFFYISCAIKYTDDKRKFYFKKWNSQSRLECFYFWHICIEVLCSRYIPILKLKICSRVEARADC
jgi:hypothetical protein